VTEFLSYNTGSTRKVQVSFYGGTFLGLDDADILNYLDRAKEYVDAGRVDSIRFSTRPDSITRKKLDLIRDYPVETIEIGVQSMDDTVLKKSGRGHNSFDAKNAVSLLKEFGYETGIQIMTGLPGDTEGKSLETARAVVGLKPDFVRIYPCVVIKDSPLALMHLQGAYEPFTLDQTVGIVKNIYLLFRKNGISVARMGLQSSDGFSSPDKNGSGDVIAGPYHPAFGHMVLSAVFFQMAVFLLENRCHRLDNITEISIEVNPRSISRVRGQNNLNSAKLQETFRLNRIKIKANPEIHEDGVSICGNYMDIDQLCREAV
jgi:coproporphyrinogen III oxidase-like Fe-S oxidoreductase